MRVALAWPASAVTLCRLPIWLPGGRRRAWLIAGACVLALALAGCAPDYDAYTDAVSERAVTRPKKHVAAKPVPLPNQALLAPQRQPDCEAEMADAQRLASLAPLEPDANADLALRIKLEYERECYRQAEMRVRDRLQKLQASTTDTIKAVKQMEQSAR
jgi:hypothetical protein